MTRKATIFPFIALAVFFAACGNKNKLKTVEPKDKIHITISRFDRDLIQMDTNNISKGIDGLKQKYPLMDTHIYHSGTWVARERLGTCKNIVPEISGR